MTQPEPDPRSQIRELIAAKLRDCPSGRFNIATMADAVMELFPEVEMIQEGRYADGSWPQRAYEFPNYIDPTHTRYELRTAPEPVKP